MKVAAYQAPLLPCGSMEAIELIRRQVERCEGEGVEVLCCPETLLGGLADYAASTRDCAIDVEGGQLSTILGPLASASVATIVGFTEIDGTGQFYNAVAVYHQGAVVGVYRKRHPAITRSIYSAGDRTQVFTVGDLTFGILICNDSNDPGLAETMVRQGAAVLFVPTNNALPPEKADVVAEARRVDAALASENRVFVVRADVAGCMSGLVSYGSSAIVRADGTLLQSGQRFSEQLLIADIDGSGW